MFIVYASYGVETFFRDRAGAQPRFQSWGRQIPGLGYYTVSQFRALQCVT